MSEEVSRRSLCDDRLVTAMAPDGVGPELLV